MPPQEIFPTSKSAGPVCVLGMHRSGTSMVTGMLSACGLWLGTEDRLMPAHPDNPDGYFENLDLVAINEAVLSQLGGSWHSPPQFPDDWETAEKFKELISSAREKIGGIIQDASGRPWGWKDPRTCITLPFWRMLFPDMKAIVCLRNPVAVARSLNRRNGFSICRGIELWNTYNRRVTDMLPGKQYIVCHYDAWFDAPENELSRLLDFVGWDVPREVIAKALQAVKKPYRRFGAASNNSLKEFGGAAPLVLYEEMRAMAGPFVPVAPEETIPAANVQPDDLEWVALAAKADKAQQFETKLSELSAQAQSQQELIAQLQKQLETQSRLITALQSCAGAKNRSVIESGDRSGIEALGESVSESAPGRIPPIDTYGSLDRVSLTDGTLTISGWAASSQAGPVRGFLVNVKNRTCTNLTQHLHRPSPDVAQVHPRLVQASQCRFMVKVALPQEFSCLHRDFPVSVTPIFDAGAGRELWHVVEASIPIPGKDVANTTRAGFQGVAFEFLQYFINKAGLRPEHRILDVGCGAGRMAYALTHYLSSQGSYEGFDIVAKPIDWAQREIGSRHQNFRFQQVPVYNSHYNPQGSTKPSAFDFPYIDEEFDFVLLASVFVHMQGSEVRHYLRQIHRVMRPGGRCLVTCFLLNQEASALIAAGLSTCNLLFSHGDGLILDPADPDAAVGFPKDLFQAWCKQAGFDILEICHGKWCGREHHVSYQDFMVLGKP